MVGRRSVLGLFIGCGLLVASLCAVGCRNTPEGAEPAKDNAPATTPERRGDSRLGAGATERSQVQPSDAGWIERTELIPNPGIINAHEHLQGGAQNLARLEEANRRVGIDVTLLVASSRFTFFLDKSSFIEHHQNNDYLCELARAHPDKYYAFVTLDPIEDDLVVKLESYMAKGASGLKLYLGHGANIGDGTPFHRFELDDPRILPVYDYCQTHRIPILFHINMRKYESEARRVFGMYPNLVFIVPHFGLKLGLRSELTALLDDFPAMYIDMSFGWTLFQFQGFERIHQKRDAIRNLVIRYQDRILFGTDVVVTQGKTADFIADSFLAYRQMLELSEYDFRVKGYDEHFRGLALSESVLRKIYHENFRRLMATVGRVQ